MAVLDELLAFTAWANPFMPAATEPTLGPWASPGRVSLAPELSDEDRQTWEAAGFAARYPTIARTLPGWLWWNLVMHGETYWQIPDDPFAAPESLRRERLRPYGELVRDILVDADLRLQVRR